MLRFRVSGLTGQMFSYLIVIDFESTCWREKNNYGQEIIEFPAVLLNTSTGEVESEFHSYVQPQEHPVLSEFCTELTGIIQKQVEVGLPLRICLSRFARWLHTLQQEKGVVYATDGRSGPASGHLCTFLTWSDWDLGVCLLYECKRKQISKPEALNSWIDLRATYRTFYSRQPKGLNGALQDLGIQFSGREHSGLDDARNTARLAWRMMTDGCVLKVTKSLNRAPLKSRPPFVHSEGQNSSSSTEDKRPSSDTQPHNNKSSAENSNPTTNVKNLVSTRTVLSSLITPVCVSMPRLHTTLQNATHSSPSHVTFDPETAACDWSEGDMVPEAGESGSYDDVLLEDEEWLGVDENSETPAVHLNTEPRPSKTRPSTPASTSAPLLQISDPYRSLTRPGRLHTTTTPSMPFSIYTDQSDRTSSTGGSFKVPYSVRPSSSTHRSRLSSSSINQLASSYSSTNQSAHTSCLVSQSALSSCSNNQSKPLSSSVNQSAFSSLSSNQSKRSSPSNNQPVLSSRSTNQSSTSSTNQSKLFSISFNQSSFSTCSTNQSALSSISANQSALSSISTNQSAVSSISANQSGLSSISINQSAVCSSTSRRLSDSRSSTLSKLSKVTSPLCGCGRRAKRLTVCNGGPNHGRAFYTCPVRRSGGSGPAHRGGCGFFKWESAVINSSMKQNSSISFSVKTTASRTFR
ncbi:hypothetical protein NFI96_019286 [Prochilodus magdalenae]|nr:hypothetical protein NFI96_019286 [Prochilodus magdalenae]